MKYILSFFMLMLPLSLGTFIWAEKSDFESEYLLHSGFTFKNTFMHTRVFTELEKASEEQPLFTLSAWSFEITPFDFLSLNVGTNSFSGVWSRFNNPSPSKISPLRQPYNLQKRLILTSPNKDSSEKPISLSFETSLPFADFHIFSTLNPDNNIFIGAGMSLPFGKNLKGNWTLAWKMTEMQAKDFDTWFTKSKYFLKDNFHSMISEVSLKTDSQVFLFSGGLAQEPYDDPFAGFFRTEYSLSFEPFILNLNMYICDIDYLSHNGSFQRKTFQTNFNPQLRFNYFTGILRSIKIGATSYIELENGSDFFDTHTWISSFDVEAEIDLLFLTIEIETSISDLLLDAKKEKGFLKIQEDSLLKAQSKILFRPWYGSIIQRIWIIQGFYEKEPFDKEDIGTLGAKAQITTENRFGKDSLLEAKLFAEGSLSIDPVEKNPSFICGFKLEYSIKGISISAQTETNPANKNIKSEFSVLYSF